MKCFEQDGHPTTEPIEVEVNDDHLYKAECKKGHVTYTMLQNHKFEVLFELGVHALIDGHPDSACTRFAVACERFYEFCIRVLALEQGLTLEDINAYWRNVGSNSQAQLGSFLILYRIEKSKDKTHQLPELLIDKKLSFRDRPDHTMFRNRFTHKGYIPTQSEAFEYGKDTYDFVAAMLRYLKDKYPDHIGTVTFSHFRGVADKPKDISVGTMDIGTAIRTARGNSFPDPSFEEVIEGIKKNNFALRK